MSDSAVATPLTVGDIVANNFMLAWNTGSFLFVERKDSKTLREAFDVAVEFCQSESCPVKTTLNTSRDELDRLIRREDCHAADDLKRIGTNIAELIKILYTN